MSPSYSFDPTDHFAVGAIGEPGARVFYLQAGSSGDLVSVKCEKQQVEALAEYLAGILADLPDPTGVAPAPALVEPPVAEWVAGSLSVAYEDTADRFVLVVEELVDPDPDPDPDRPEPEVASLRVHLSRAQVAAFITAANDVVHAGRPPCELCGHPKGPDHVCPKWNGHGPPR